MAKNNKDIILSIRYEFLQNATSGKWETKKPWNQEDEKLVSQWSDFARTKVVGCCSAVGCLIVALVLPMMMLMWIESKWISLNLTIGKIVYTNERRRYTAWSSNVPCVYVFLLSLTSIKRTVPMAFIYDRMSILAYPGWISCPSYFSRGSGRGGKSKTHKECIFVFLECAWLKGTKTYLARV